MICGVQKFRKLNLFFIVFLYAKWYNLFIELVIPKKENEYGVCKMELSGIREILL